jgi:hypothetical protein
MFGMPFRPVGIWPTLTVVVTGSMVIPFLGLGYEDTNQATCNVATGGLVG